MKSDLKSTRVNMQNLQTLFFGSGRACACPLALRWNSPDRLIRVRMLCNRKAPDPPVTGYTQNEQRRGCYPELAGRFLGLAKVVLPCRICLIEARALFSDGKRGKRSVEVLPC